MEARQVLDDIFRSHPLRKVYALVHGYNAESLQSNLAAGFEEEGVMRA